MRILKIYPTSIDSHVISEAVDMLREGSVIIFPTDTLYAFGCDALNNRAIERVCRVKNIDPRKECLSTVCADISQASEYARIDNRAFKILREYLPGPYTFILPAATTLPKVFKGRKTVGIRVPDNPIAVALARELGHPLLSTSVPVDYNAEEESVNPDSIAMRHSAVADLIIDGGEGGCDGSTVVDITDSRAPVVVRAGVGVWE